MKALMDQKIAVLCVDDNEDVAEALRIKLSLESDFEWKGWLPDADFLTERTREACPNIVILDIDMPGRSVFEAVVELGVTCPDSRVVLFSGYVQRGLIERAIESGVWGYASKNDGEAALMDVLRQVAAGEFALSPEVQEAFDRG